MGITGIDKVIFTGDYRMGNGLLLSSTSANIFHETFLQNNFLVSSRVSGNAGISTTLVLVATQDVFLV